MSTPTRHVSPATVSDDAFETANPSDNASADVPSQLGDFSILRKLGEGAYCQVFLACQVSLGRQVALKVNRGQETGRYEGKLLAVLEHDHIVKVFSEFSEPSCGAHGLCLQYIPGTNLGCVIQHLHENAKSPENGKAILAALDAHRQGEIVFDPGALRDREALAAENFWQAVCRLGARLAEALAFAHSKGVLHCDIKPANILITPYGRPMLADFNVGFDRERHHLVKGYGGTLAYSAPEHSLALRGLPGGNVDERCDVYSLGVVLVELATGKRPPSTDPYGECLTGDSANLTKAIEQIPRELATVIRRSLDFDVTTRYQTAGELAQALMGAWHLIAVRRSLPIPGKIGVWVNVHPIAALILAGLLSHITASIVNIGYNAVQIQLANQDQKTTFAFLVLVYNSVAYPLIFGIVGIILWKLRQQLIRLPQATKAELAETRDRVRRWGWWTLALGAIGWFPGGILFPVALDVISGPLPWDTYVHFAVSLTLSGLIGVVFCYLLTEYVVFCALIPRLSDPDSPRGTTWNEFGPLTTLYAPFLVLACAVPLSGAVLLVAFADGTLTLGFRVLVTGLIGLGVVGVGLAERLTRKLRSLAEVWEHEAVDVKL
jgi:serine/threonine protein kinase